MGLAYTKAPPCYCCCLAQVCLPLFVLTMISSLLYCTTNTGESKVYFSVPVVGASWEDGCGSSVNTSADWGRSVTDGHWYDFSHRPLFVFYVYSAFLVNHASSQHVIRLVSITSPVHHFTGQRLDVFCLVRYSDGSQPHLASILHRPPRRITEPAWVKGYEVGDYVYSCLLPSDHPTERVPVSRLGAKIIFKVF